MPSKTTQKSGFSGNFGC